MEQGGKNQDKPKLMPSEPAAPHPCANGCSFFGSPANGNLCSKCYRESAEVQAASSSAHVPVDPDAVLATTKEPDEEEETGPAKIKNRCAACGRRVGLMGFECRCGGVFCGVHRYSDRHECGYDYRGAGRDAIAEANPVVRAEKVDKL